MMHEHEFYIGKVLIKSESRPLIIAEAGSNHNQSFDMALRLIDSAAEMGAHAIKFQLFSADKLYAPGNELYDIFKSIELNREWVPKLARHADDHGVIFLASPFDDEAVDLLAEVGAAALKVASSETVNFSLVKRIAEKGKPVIVSTGMCDLADVHEAVEVIRSEGNEDIVLLHCSALYPTPPDKVHLKAMDTMRAAFQLPVGFSDHTLDIVAPIAAVARGACVIEKHLTLDRGLPGPDHSYALEPQDFRRMVDSIDATWKALGSPVKKMLPEEAKYARRESLRAARDIDPGEMITRDMLVFERPGNGIRPRFVSAVVGQRSQAAISKGEAIEWKLIRPKTGE
jgi:N,N'-diacetyllegionaminate synthase